MPTIPNVRCPDCQSIVAPATMLVSDEGITCSHCGRVVHGPKAVESPCFLLPGKVWWNPFDPDPAKMRIEDIAHILSRDDRYGRTLPEPYYVAQHAVLVSHVAVDMSARAGGVPFGFGPMRPADAFEGIKALHHEDGEAYSGLGDCVGPVKRHHTLAGIKALERGIEDAASVAFRLPVGFAHERLIKAADDLVYHWENRDLRDIEPPVGVSLPAERLVPVSWKVARQMFLDRAGELEAARGAR